MDFPRKRLLFFITGISTGGAHQSAIAWIEMLRASGRFDVTLLVGLEGWFTQQLRARGIPFAMLPLPPGLGAIKHGTWNRKFLTGWRILTTIPMLLSAWIRVAFMRVDGVVLTGGRDFIMLFPLVLRMGRNTVTIPQSTDWADIPTCRLMCRMVTRVYAISTAVADSIVKMGIPPAKVEVLPLIFAPDRASEFPQKDVLRARLNLPQNELLIGMVGLVRPNKGQMEAVRIFDMVREVIPKCRLVIAGAAMADQPVAIAYEKEIKKLVEDLGIQGSVTFLGWRDDVPAIMRSFDLLLVPSHDREGVPRVILEGLEAALPVLATDLPQFQEVLGEFDAGFLFPVSDLAGWTRTAIELLGDEGRRETASRHARDVWDRHYSEHAVRPVLLDAFARAAR